MKTAQMTIMAGLLASLMSSLPNRELYRQGPGTKNHYRNLQGTPVTQFFMNREGDMNLKSNGDPMMATEWTKLRSTGRYMPHQGAREIARRLRKSQGASA